MERYFPAQVATRLLLRQRMHNLRFDVRELQFEKKIVFDTIQHYCAVTRASLPELEGTGAVRDGLTVVQRGGAETVYIVLLNDRIRHPGRRNFTLAHEIGHIILDHWDDGDQNEREADQFAAQLLAPGILVDQLARLWGRRLTSELLQDVFGVSRQMARQRLARLGQDAAYCDEDDLLLSRLAPLLPRPGEPVITL